MVSALRTTVNAGPRLDRLITSPLHRRVMWIVGLGMFFDGFDFYVAASLPQSVAFVTLPLLGMMLGSIVTGFLGDKYGRRFMYQANLLILGLAALAAAIAPNMVWLNVMRFIMGAGLGAESVVGYAMMTELAPARTRGKWLALVAVFILSGLPAAALLASWAIPYAGWRPMFIIGGIGALIVWSVRKYLPESPRWLETVGRMAEAETIVESFEASAAVSGVPAPVLSARRPAPAQIGLRGLFTQPLLRRMIAAVVLLFTVNAWLYGFITWIPQFFAREGMGIATTFSFARLMSFGAPVGSLIGVLTADAWGRKRTIIGASALTIAFAAIYPLVHDAFWLPIIGFCLTVRIYVLVALSFGVYVPEMFPTEVRLRASGIANMVGCGAAVVVPPLVLSLFTHNGVAGVLTFMIALTVVQIVVVATFGIEPRKRGLEDLDGDARATTGVTVQSVRA